MWFDPVTGKLKAIQSAEGFGASTLGGIDGPIPHVTNRNSSGEGSLRAAVAIGGCVVFDIEGYMGQLSGLKVAKPLSIFGQTAPGKVVVRSDFPRTGNPCMWINTPEVVLQYIGLRPGAPSRSSGSQDALFIGSVTDEPVDVFNILIDHGSFGWSIDEVTSTSSHKPSDTALTHNITIQWSSISESLDFPEPPHQKGSRHAYGTLIDKLTDKVTFHHDLWAHHRNRLPTLEPDWQPMRADIWNCLLYDWIDALPLLRGEQINFMSNFMKAGPNSNPLAMMDTKKNRNVGYPLYLDGNIRQLFGAIALPVGAEELILPGERGNLVDVPHDSPRGEVTGAMAAYEDVLLHAGIGDAVDVRIANDVRNATGSVIDMPSDVGGYPPIPHVPSIPSDSNKIPLAYWASVDMAPDSNPWGVGQDNVPHFFKGMDWYNNPGGIEPPIDPPPPDPTEITLDILLDGKLTLKT